MVNVSRMRHILLVLFAGIILFTSFQFGVGRVDPDDFADSSQDILLIPAYWVKLDSNDWIGLAEKAAIAGDQDKNYFFTLKALASDLTSGEAVARLTQILSLRGREQDAKQAANLAGRLAPAQTSTHIRLANYWYNQNQPDQMLAEWNILLIRNPHLVESMFPQLEQMLLVPETTGLFYALAARKPLWWEIFFIKLTESKQIPLELLARIYHLQNQPEHPALASETTAYLKILMESGQWSTAYEIWQSSLSGGISGQKSLVYDGGFEEKLQNTGFAWNLYSDEQVKSQRDHTYNMEGNRALHITLSGSEHINFWHVWQYLVLKPGFYTLDFRVRTDNLLTDKGLQWRIRCINEGQFNTVLVESPALAANPLWTDYSVNFNIPAENCHAQKLALENASYQLYEQVFTGSFWFDAISINLK